MSRLKADESDQKQKLQEDLSFLKSTNVLCPANKRASMWSS